MQLFTNNAVGSLASGVNATDNTLVLVAGDGAKFPAITGEDFFLLTLTQSVGLETSWEIVKCTARSGDSLTVVRAQEGTAGQAWAAGSKVDLRVTAGTLEAKANLASPTFTGTPEAPKAAVGTNTTQLATTAHVFAERAATATLTNKTITTPLITGTREVRVAMPANAIDLATGNLFTKTISGATTLTVSNVPTTGTAASFILELTNAGSAAITWFSGVKWAGGTAPTLTASGVDVLGFYTHNGGATWRGFLLSKDSK